MPNSTPSHTPLVALNLALLINTLSIGSLMMAMPLGADFVAPLGMRPEHIGYISGTATLAAAAASLLAAPWLDRCPRKHALVVLVALRFLTLGACALARDGTDLLLLFVIAGALSGPLGAVLMAAMLDLIPPAERGRRLAYVAMGFSLAAIVVVPFALSVSQYLDWRSPFLITGASGLLLAGATAWWFPPLGAASRRPRQCLTTLLRHPLCRVAMLVAAVQMAGHAGLVPHFASFFQFNLGVARADIPGLYLAGGLASIVAMRLGGRLIDQGHGLLAVAGSNLTLIAVTLAGFALQWPLPLLPVFTLFMAMSSARFSATQAIVSAIPAPDQRAAFMALQNTMVSVASGAAGIASAAYLGSAADGALIGFDRLAWLAAGGILFALGGMVFILRRLRATDAASATPAEVPTGG
ncbi:MFS transporter [Halomonas koreensis]|uniref:MFS transporter n=1 Tax=Halomonas koreensis TaxID=245385 RepID=A0ABU1G1B2_9GAMM|nr:MFS transporter [Halomonas koreensis]MDR5866714.1 MFS transporter [Halomonas koreensis]